VTNVVQHRPSTAWASIGTAIAEDGSARHPHVRRLLAPRVQRRDLADAVHAICAVHGHQPGMADEALERCVQPDACEWLGLAAAGFADERAAVAQLVAAAGPLPSTPGQAESEAALAGVRHAIEMLARSDRGGCATGAAAALVGDWITIRAVLDHAGDCFAAPLPAPTLPDPAATEAAIAPLAAAPPAERAMMFGARQLLAQHRGLWDLLEARASARG
jgi:hypothetical protein